MLRNAASLSAFPTSTWTGLPAAASAQGQIFRVTDVGISGVGIKVISDGTRWVPLGPQVLARSAVASTITGSTAETTTDTITVPGGLLGANGTLRVVMDFSGTNNANNKTLKIKYGGTTFYNFASNTYASWGVSYRISNRNATASQLGATGSTSGTGTVTAAVVTGAVDSTVDQSLVVTHQLAVGTDTSTRERLIVEILP